MQFKPWLPHPLLQPYIRYYTYMELGEKDIWTSSAVAPTGCPVMCVLVGDEQPLFNRQSEPIQPLSVFNVTGQTTQFTPFSFYGQHKVISIVFHPWGPFRLLGISQCHFKDLCSDLFDLVSFRDRCLQQQFLDCQTAEATFSVLEPFLLRILQQKKEKSNFTRIASICRLLMQQSSAPLLLKNICKEQGISKSSLERNFNEYVGIGFKQYQKILRFHHLLNHIKQQKDFRHWTEIAYRFGYYDQAHFIKDFKLFYGKTPSAFSSNDEFLSSMVQ